MENYRFRLVVKFYDENYSEELLVYISFSPDKTIGELKQFVENKLAERSMEGKIYYLFNDQEILHDELLLGSELFPNDLLIRDSMLETNGILYAECSTLDQEREQAEDQETNIVQGDITNELINYLSSRITNNYNSFNQIFNNSNIDIITTRLDHLNSISIPLNSTLNYAMFNNLLGLFGNIQPNQPNQSMEDIRIGLHKDDLENLRVDHYKNFEIKDKCDTCSVCIEKFKDEDTCRELRCHHLFHKNCIDAWLEDNIKCPLCRMETGRGVPKI